MKKILLLILVLVLVVPFTSCKLLHSAFNFGEHTYEYIQHESGHFKQYTCGCPGPDIIEEHYDHNEDDMCDACGYVSNPFGVAQIVLDYEQSLRDKFFELQAENPEYKYFYNPVYSVSCSFDLEEGASADAIVEKYDMKSLFADAKISAWNSIETVRVTFERNDFTENVHQKLNQICESETLIKSLDIYMQCYWDRSYMPKIECYTDYPTILKYEPAPCAVRTEICKNIIIRSKEEYCAYLDELIKLWETSDDLMARYEMGQINAVRDKYDEAFFEENALILTRMVARGSGSIRLTVDNLYISEDKVYVVIRTDEPNMGTCDMQYAFFAFVVDKDDVIGVNKVVTLD